MGGEFKDCLRIYFSATGQSPGDWTDGYNASRWYAHNLGPIKANETTFFRHPVEDTGVVISTTIKPISATVDGVHYGFPSIFGGPQ